MVVARAASSFSLSWEMKASIASSCSLPESEVGGGSFSAECLAENDHPGSHSHPGWRLEWSDDPPWAVPYPPWAGLTGGWDCDFFLALGARHRLARKVIGA